MDAKGSESFSDIKEVAKEETVDVVHVSSNVRSAPIVCMLYHNVQRYNRKPLSYSSRVYMFP